MMDEAAGLPAAFPASPPFAVARAASTRSTALLRRPAWRRVAPYLGSALALALFFGALYLMHRQVAAYRVSDVRRALRGLGWEQLALAVGLTVVSYALLTVYDVLALRHIRKVLPYGRVALASFTSYAFTHSLGFGSIMHATIRYRLYVPLGLRTIDIAEVTAFVNITFMIGLGVMFPAIAVIDADAVEGLGVPHATSLAFGSGALALVVAYCALGLWVHRPIPIFGFPISVPRPGTAIGQVGLSLADIALAAAILWMCLPHGEGVPYGIVVGVFVIALTAGIISHVPGGLGVFDTIVLVGLQDYLPGDRVLAALLVFRLIYFLLPLLIAGGLFGTIEALRARRRLAWATQSVAGWIAPGVPLVLAGCSFVAGAVLLFSNATPEYGRRLRVLYAVLPLPVLELSHFVASIIGVVLLLLASRLQRRSHAAWLLTVALLGIGSVSLVLKGLEWEPAALLLVLAAMLWAARDEFYRRGALVAERFTPGWFLAVGVVLGSALWLGLFSYKHVRYHDELWWHFALFGDASRFLRASVAVAVIALVAAVRRLLASVRGGAELPGDKALAQAAEIAAQAPEARAQLALIGGSGMLIDPEGDALILYGVSRRSWIALGDPIGPPARWSGLFSRLAALARRQGGWPVFYGISRTGAQSCQALGFAVRRIGDQAIVPLDDLAPETLDPALAATRARLRDATFTFEVVGPDERAALLPELRRIAETWLRRHGRNSSADPMLDGLARFPAALVRRHDRIVGFATLVGSASKAELSVERMRYVAEAEGIADFILVEAMLWAKAEGYRSFNLGLAPLRGFERRDVASRWIRLGIFLYRHGEHYHDFRELRRAKARFRPRWEPRFMASARGLALSRMLPDLARLVAGGAQALLAR